MAIRGTLREASLPDVLQLLAMGQKTGCLGLTHVGSFGSIYFERGRITYASVVDRRGRRGGRVAAGEALSREERHRRLRVQIEEAVYHLFTWSEGTFNFEPELRPAEHDVPVAISPESLLLEGARRVDEWSLIEQAIPSFDLIFALEHAHLDAARPELTPEQATLLPLIDGRRDVDALVEAAGLVAFDVARALHGLATAGLLRQVGRSEPAAVPHRTDLRAAEHHDLGVAFYRAGMFDEALRELRCLVELRPHDVAARFHLGLVEMRQGRWDEAVRSLQSAAAQAHAPAAVWHNLAYALEWLGRTDEARRALDEAAARGAADDPRLLTSRAVLALRTGDLAAADGLLREARERWGRRTPPAAWFHHAALVAALLGDADGALTLLDEGAQAHPHVAALHNNQAALLERRGDDAGALAAVERGLLADGSLAQLHRNAGDLHHRAGRFDAALESYARAVRADPALGGDVYRRLGDLHFHRQEHAEAERCWTRALELDPTNAAVRGSLTAVRRTVA